MSISGKPAMSNSSCRNIASAPAFSWRQWQLLPIQTPSNRVRSSGAAGSTSTDFPKLFVL